MKKPKKYNLNIFDVLSKMNSSSSDIYETLSEEERKDLSPLILMRWMRGCKDYSQIVRLNDNVNPYIFTLSKHPHLLCKLMQASASQKRLRYNFIPFSKKVCDKLSNKVIMEYTGLSSIEIKKLRLFPSSEDVIKMANELGWASEDIKKLQKEMSK